MRPDKRAPNELRPIKITKNYLKHAEGSVLVEFGDTKVICTASVISGVPRFLKDSGKGWLTAEYGMLPRSTHTRNDREASKGKQGGRTLEIQRLIGRALRSITNLELIGENTITIDCDVIQADGGTRTAAITGSYLALKDATKILEKKLKLNTPIIKQTIAAISVGIHNGQTILDLNYHEDCNAETDMNVVMTEDGNFVEIQGTAEKNNFTQEQLLAMLELAKAGISELFAKQYKSQEN